MLRFVTQTTRGSLANGNADAMQPYVLGSAIPAEYHAYYHGRVTYVTPNVAVRNTTRTATPAPPDMAAALARIPPVNYRGATAADVRHRVMSSIYAIHLRVAMPAPITDGIITARAQGLAAVRLAAEHAYDLDHMGYDASQLHAAGDHPTFLVGADGVNSSFVIAGAGDLTLANLNAWYQRFDNSEGRQIIDHQFALLGTGFYATTGVNLCRDGHNCTKPHYAVHDAVMRQILRTADQAANDAIMSGLSKDDWRDLYVHKSMHVFAGAARKAIAKDPNTALRLVAYGLGSAAVRIPAITDEEALLAAQQALVDSAEAALTSANVAVDRLLVSIEGDIQSFARQVAQAATTADRARVGRHFRNRADSRISDIAFVGGFVKAMCTDHGIDLKKVSQLKARSVERAMDNQPIDVARGAQRYTEWKNRSDRMSADGALTGYALGGSAVPPDITRKHWTSEIAVAIAPFLAGGLGAAAAGAPATAGP